MVYFTESLRKMRETKSREEEEHDVLLQTEG